MVVFFVFALMNWTSVEFRWRWMELLSKPLALLALVLCFWDVLGWQGLQLWFGLGLIFSLVGDFFLLWSERFFLPGLVSFLLAHLCYLLGFNQDPLFMQWGVVIAVVLATTIGFSGYRTIRKGMQRRPENANMRWPVLFYCLVITLMMLSAWLCILRPEWSTAAGWLAAIGATFFVISDMLLAYGKFVRQIDHGDLWVMITYHLGQVGILFGVLLRYSG